MSSPAGFGPERGKADVLGVISRTAPQAPACSHPWASEDRYRSVRHLGRGAPAGCPLSGFHMA